MLQEQNIKVEGRKIQTFHPSRDTAKLLLEGPNLHKSVASYIPVEKAIIAQEDSYDSGLDRDAENSNCHTNLLLLMQSYMNRENITTSPSYLL